MVDLNSGYLVYPLLDNNKQFPTEVNQGIANSPEMQGTYVNATDTLTERKSIHADMSVPKGFAPTISTSPYTIADMRADGTQILLTGGYSIAFTNDDLVTSTNNTTVFSYAVTAARYLDNGEIIVAVNCDIPTSTKGTLWRSTGWAANPATATFTKVLTAFATTGWFTNSWSIDTYKNIVIIAEYGPQGADNARKVWGSTDYGMTFNVIFDLGVSADLRAHMHGVAYDRYWNRIWLSNGDGVANCAIRYSDDFGATWTVYQSGSNQVVTILPMPKAILFSTDMAPNGIARAMRLPGKKVAPLDNPYTTDSSSTLTILGGRMYRRDEGSPALISFISQTTAADVGRIVATQDGINFYELFKDAPAYAVNGGGVNSIVGPTARRQILATLGGTSRGNQKIISPDVDWVGSRRHAKSHAPGGSDALDLTAMGAADISVGAKVWISAAELNLVSGTQSKVVGSTAPDTSGGVTFISQSPDVDATVDASKVVPSSWATMNIDLYWTESNNGGVGNVVWRAWSSAVVNGGSIANGAILGLVTDSAPVYPNIKVTRLASGAPVADSVQRLDVRRLASQPTDTLTTNSFIYGILLTKAS